MFVSCLSDRINYYTRSDQLFNGKPINQYGVTEEKGGKAEEEGDRDCAGHPPTHIIRVPPYDENFEKLSEC